MSSIQGLWFRVAGDQFRIPVVSVPGFGGFDFGVYSLRLRLRLDSMQLWV